MSIETHHSFAGAGAHSMTQNDERSDHIHIEKLEIFAHIGVPDEERASPQRLTFSISLWPIEEFQHLNDQIARTVDYAAVCEETKTFVQRRSDKLIETLADEVARHLLEVFQIRRIRIELRKYVLPDVEFVSVTVTRDRPV
jgi:dihydroneopterin aldolase